MRCLKFRETSGTWSSNCLSFITIVHLSSSERIFWHSLGFYFRNTGSKYFVYCSLGFKRECWLMFHVFKKISTDYWLLGGKTLVCLNYPHVQQCLWILVLSHSDPSFWIKNQDTWFHNQGSIWEGRMVSKPENPDMPLTI